MGLTRSQISEAMAKYSCLKPFQGQHLYVTKHYGLPKTSCYKMQHMSWGGGAGGDAEKNIPDSNYNGFFVLICSGSNELQTDWRFVRTSFIPKISLFGLKGQMQIYFCTASEIVSLFPLTGGQFIMVKPCWILFKPHFDSRVVPEKLHVHISLAPDHYWRGILRLKFPSNYLNNSIIILWCKLNVGTARRLWSE